MIANFDHIMMCSIGTAWGFGSKDVGFRSSTILDPYLISVTTLS